MKTHAHHASKRRTLIGLSWTRTGNVHALVKHRTKPNQGRPFHLAGGHRVGRRHDHARVIAGAVRRRSGIRSSSRISPVPAASSARRR